MATPVSEDASVAHLLPDGRRFPAWDDVTTYGQTYVVDQNHPSASDRNPGTRALPWRTIGRAAQVLEPGKRVVVSAGIYRERIEPVRGGRGAGEMVAYEAAPGHKVVVSGSRILPSAWSPSVDPCGEDFSYRLWQIELPDTLFPYEDRPFAKPNATDAEIELMPWALRWRGRVPYTLPRGLVFQDGRRLIQLATYEDLVRLPGSYWVPAGGRSVHVHTYGRMDPNECIFEVTVQEHLLRPAVIGLGYIKVKGFTFEHAGNGYPRVGSGAVYVRGGHHWIIEDNTVRECNSVGIEAGARTDEAVVSTPEENARVREHVGGFVIRRNEVHDCGTGGIEGHTVRNTLIEDNHIHHIGWQDVERYWECAAIKTLLNVNTLVRRNLIHDIESASGIWLDWDNRNCRVTQNILIDVLDASNGALFIEASRVPNWIDHNVIWNCWRAGVTLFDTDNTLVAHNLIAHTENPIASRVNTDRSLNGVPLTSQGNVIRNNLFYENELPPLIEALDNACDANVYAASCTSPAIPQGGNVDWDVSSASRQLRIDLGRESLELTLTGDPLPPVPAVEASSTAIPDGDCQEREVAPGPFPGVCGAAVVLRLGEA